jgi:para-nitrobenzyl esterase
MNSSTITNPTVRTRFGTLEGLVLDGLFVFRGIPYAAPPVGPLRWRPPSPPTAWSGVRTAFSFGPIAPQNRTFGGFPGFTSAEPQDEDCLYLNIWTPGLDDARRPVLVWIHGGVFNAGAGSLPAYDGSRLAARGDVVVVTINYRLGMLGFLNLNEVTGGRIPATGNEGLLDQMAAFSWVRENIGAFGGDPENVTAFGESAGAMSIGCMLAMPRARGLFDRAILESGAGNTAVPLDAAVEVAESLLKQVNIVRHDTEALLAIPFPMLLHADLKLRSGMAGPDKPPRHGVTAPVIEGVLLPEVPLHAIRRGSGSAIPLIIGTNRDEWRIFGSMNPRFLEITEEDMVRRLKPFFPSEYASRLLEVYRKARGTRGEGTSPLDLVSAILTDEMFRMRALRVVEAQEGVGAPVYNYVFQWKTTPMAGLLGACHLAEIGFVFGTLDERFFGSGPDAVTLSRCMQDAWIAFSRSGDPSSAGVGPWLPYGKGRLTMILDRECRLEEMFCEDERRVWDEIPGARDR